MATVTEAVKETLVGTTREPELSSQTKATFDRNARQDDENGEPYMTETEFVNAIAPATEDYVSFLNLCAWEHEFKKKCTRYFGVLGLTALR